MAATERPPLTFDDVTIDFAGRRVLRAGEAQPLEPKAFEVLALLSSVPGQVFTRDQILDGVWGHRHITPGVLNRVMTMLRHAVGEDANTPRYLHTVHGIGYRFDLPSAATARPVATAGEVERPVIAAAASLAISGESVVPRRRASDFAAPPARVARRWWLVCGVLLVVGVVVGGWWRWVSPSPVATAPPVLAVLPLRALGDAPRAQDFADGLSEELVGLLARLRGLRVTSSTSSTQFRQSPLGTGEIARHLRATHVLEGSVRQDGQRLRISVRLVEAAGDRLLWSQEYDRDAGDIFVIQDNIAHAVATALQLQLQVGATPVVPAKEDPILYRRYLLARGLIMTGRAGDARAQAETELREIIAEHPGYARAWGGLALTLWFHSLRPGPSRNALRAEAERAAATALRLDPQQTEAHAVLAGQACREQRWHDCLVLSERAVQLAPSDTSLRGGHASHLVTMGYVDAALKEIDTAQAIDPLSSRLHSLRGRVLDTLGRHDEARTHLLRADPVAAATALYFNAAWRGDYAEARRIALALPADTLWRAPEVAAAEALADPTLWPAALRAIDVAEMRSNSHDGQVAYVFARLLLPHRDYARDIDGLDHVQREGYAHYQWVFWQPESRALRQHPAFQQYLHRSGLLAFWHKHGFPPQCRTEGDGAICD